MTCQCQLALELMRVPSQIFAFLRIGAFEIVLGAEGGERSLSYLRRAEKNLASYRKDASFNKAISIEQIFETTLSKTCYARDSCKRRDLISFH